jgi:hypothetical protein
LAVLGLAFAWLVIVAALLIVFQSRLVARVFDLHCEVSLQRALDAGGYVPRGLFLEDAAPASPSLALAVWKFMEMTSPRSILELGSGQTTKLVATYLRSHPEARATTIEESADFHRFFGPSLAEISPRLSYLHAPLGNVSAGNDQVRWYQLPAEAMAAQYDFILIDGPVSYGGFCRDGIVPFLPKLLGESFIIVVDDTNRPNELRMCDSIAKQLDGQTNGKFFRFEIHGAKSQTVFCSSNFGFLRYS